MKLADFILSHDGDDLAALALARSRYATALEADGGGLGGGLGAGLASGRRAGEAAFDLALTTLEVRRKLRDKVPQWHAVPSLVYPLRISGEQCSSSATARYKASVALAASQQALLTENACCHVSSDAAASTFAQKRLPRRYRLPGNQQKMPKVLVAAMPPKFYTKIAEFFVSLPVS